MARAPVPARARRVPRPPHRPRRIRRATRPRCKEPAEDASGPVAALVARFPAQRRVVMVIAPVDFFRTTIDAVHVPPGEPEFPQQGETPPAAVAAAATVTTVATAELTAVRRSAARAAPVHLIFRDKDLRTMLERRMLHGIARQAIASRIRLTLPSPGGSTTAPVVPFKRASITQVVGTAAAKTGTVTAARTRSGRQETQQEPPHPPSAGHRRTFLRRG